MAFIIRSRVDRDFTVLPNRLIRDKRLKWSDKGMLMFLLHLPPDFQANLAWLQKQTPDGRDAAQSCVKRLRTYGYISIVRERDPYGKFMRTVWSVTDTPPPQTDFPDTEEPAVVEPHAEKPQLISTSVQQDLSEATTTSEAGQRDQCAAETGERNCNLRYPDLFGGDERNAAKRILEKCPAEERQSVLDEVAGLADRGAVRHPMGLLRRLVDRARQGDFTPSAAIEYARKLQRESEARVRMAKEHAEQERRSSPEAREAAREALANIRHRLALRGRTAAAATTAAVSPSVVVGGDTPDIGATSDGGSQ